MQFFMLLGCLYTPCGTIHYIQCVIFTKCSSGIYGRHRSWQTQKVCGNLKQCPNNATGCLSLPRKWLHHLFLQTCEGGTEVDCAAMWCQWGHCQHKVHMLLLASFPGSTQLSIVCSTFTHGESLGTRLCCYYIIKTRIITKCLEDSNCWLSTNDAFFFMKDLDKLPMNQLQWHFLCDCVFSYKHLSQEVLGSIDQWAIELYLPDANLSLSSSVRWSLLTHIHSPSFHTLQHW